MILLIFMKNSENGYLLYGGVYEKVKIISYFIINYL